MKVGAISGDMAVKLGLGVLALGVVGYLAYKASSAAAAAAAWAGDNLNPASQNNVAYQTVNSFGGAIVSDPAGPGMNADGSWTLGGWIYDITH